MAYREMAVWQPESVPVQKSHIASQSMQSLLAQFNRAEMAVWRSAAGCVSNKLLLSPKVCDGF